MNKIYQKINALYDKHKQIILFLSVGAVNTFLGFLLFAALIYFGMNYIVACLVITIIGIFFNFATMGKIVFHNSNPLLIFRYILMNIVNYLLSVLFLKLFSYSINDMYVNGAIVTILMAGYTYYVSKYYVFRETAFEVIKYDLAQNLIDKS